MTATDDALPTPTDAGHGPARRYSWAPFTPGHELSTSHGAWSERKVAPLAAELLAWIADLATRPDSAIAYLADESYALALRRWATIESRCELLRSWLDDRTTPSQPGDIDDDGEIRPAAMLLARWEATASKQAERLGLDPLARTKLGAQLATTAANLAAVDAAGAAALAARPSAEPTTATETEPEP